MSEQTEVDAQVEDWGSVWSRARAKAAGLTTRPVADEPVAETAVNEIIGRFLARAKSMPVDTSPEPPRHVPRSAIEVRLEWYVPPRHWHDTLDSFRPVTESQRNALEATRVWVESIKAGDGGALALLGEVGSGKSHLMYAAVRELNEAGIHAAAGGWYDLADLFRQAKFGHDEDVTEARLRKARYLNSAALAIDEIRPTSGTDYDTTELSQLMTRAYRERQGVIVTSNYADEKLSRIVGLAASSRLTQVVIKGPDMRQPHNRNRHLIAS